MRRRIAVALALASAAAAIAGCSNPPVTVIPLSPPEPGWSPPRLDRGWYVGMEGGGWIPSRKLRVTSATGERIRSSGNAWTAGPYLGYRFSPEVALQGGYQYAGAEDWTVHLGHAGLSFGVPLSGFAPYLRGSVLVGGPDLNSSRIERTLEVQDWDWGLEGGAGIRIPLGAHWEISADGAYRWLDFRIRESPGTIAPARLDLSGFAGFLRVGYLF
ncbi:MAG: outer membrane beta-barrel protein [Planctomycetes bacterium]|nr:outer membrane beta-barrel protein [Planctomycetota bacterium]